MAEPTYSIYEEVIRITHVYLGPASDRFITRQVHNHLQKPAEELTANDLRKMIDWIQLAMSLLTDDSKLVARYTAELQALAKRGTAKRDSHGK